MGRTPGRKDAVRVLWERARSGDLRGAMDAARRGREAVKTQPARCELHLVAAFCAMRLGEQAEAAHELDAAALAAASPIASERFAWRVEVWRAELAYFQGRYSAATDIVDRLLERLEMANDWAYAGFALRIRIAILLARADYEGAQAQAARALDAAERSGDDYVLVQILNVLGAVHFDCATSKLPEPHARSHLSGLEPADAAPMEKNAHAALALFQRAREVAERAGYQFAAWYVAGNIERLEILLGHAERAVRAIRKRLGVLQAKGAKYDEIVTRSNLAWGLRTLGHHEEALHELDVALALVRETGVYNVLLEFLYYDRSVVLYALGDVGSARVSYRRYLHLAGGTDHHTRSATDPPLTSVRRPLEPFFLKRVDRYIVEHIGERITVSNLALHCGVSSRTLLKAFTDFRGVPPVVHVRNLRLDHARRALAEQDSTVGGVAARFGFQSATTFALEYHKRFGIPPSRTKRKAEWSNVLTVGTPVDDPSTPIPTPKSPSKSVK